MKKTILKILAVSLAVVLMFCITTEPFSVSASTNDIDFSQTTSLSVTELQSAIAELSSGEVTIIYWVLGLIASLFLGSRLVDANIDNSSFEAVGQYLIDNMTADFKNLCYSVYLWVHNNSFTSLADMPDANFLSFSSAYAQLKNFTGSVVTPTESTEEFLDVVYSDPTISFASGKSYSYTSELESVFDLYSGFDFTYTIGNTYGSNTSEYAFYDLNTDLITSDIYVIFYYSSTKFYFDFYSIDSNILTKITSIPLNIYTFSFGTSYTAAPNLSSYSSAVSFGTTYYSFVLPLISSYSSSRYFQDQWLEAFKNLGCGVASSSVSLSNTLTLDDITILQQRDFTASNDVISVPTDETIPFGLSEVVEALNLGELTNTLDLTNTYLQDLTLTLDSATTSTVTEVTPNYAIPDLTDVWKYPKYLWTMLGSWVEFCGKCLDAVTVGQGGLSWLFYGGFVILVCGGIVGKILLG